MQSGSNRIPTESQSGDACGDCLVCLAWIVLVLFFPFSLCCAYGCALEYQRILIFRNGRLRPKVYGPGLYFKLPCVDTTVTVDLRMMTFDVPPQEILTKDSLSVGVDAVVFYCIFDPQASVTQVANVHASTQLLSQTMLRNILGLKTLPEILADREGLARQLQVALDRATDIWGIKVDRVDIQQVTLPPQLLRSMAAEAESGREAKAKVIAAEGELKASKALTAAAAVIAHSPGAIQLRYLQSLASIVRENNETYIFPLPMNLLREFCRSRSPMAQYR